MLQWRQQGAGVQPERSDPESIAAVPGTSRLQAEERVWVGGDLVATRTISHPAGFSHLGFSHCARRGQGRVRGIQREALGPSPQPGRQQDEGTGCALAAGPQLSASLSVPAPAGQPGPDATPHPMTQQKVKPDPPLLAGTQCPLFPHPRGWAGRGWLGRAPACPRSAPPGQGCRCAPAHPRVIGAHRLLSHALFVNHQSCPTEFWIFTLLGGGVGGE